jgi:hypothetical protein
MVEDGNVHLVGENTYNLAGANEINGAGVTVVPVC